ncbi:MAG: FecR domain-containing protein [Alistipes sp.]|nr:FecR domain-containing protein [Alistipes sp.]
MDWLDASQENRDRFEAERAIFDALALHAPGIGSIKEPVRNTTTLRTIARTVAAAAAMLALIAGAGRYMQSQLRNELQSKTTTLTVPSGQRMSLVLDDGTHVWLNSDTEFEFPALFGKERRVRVNGEAMFDVTHDPAHPFIVETFAGELEVLGTKFNVEADRQAGVFPASLLEGKLKVTDRLTPGGQEFIMMPDNTVVLADGRMSLKMLRNHNDFLWTEGIISLEDTAFDELMKQFGKYFDLDIRIERDELPRINYSRGKIRIMDGFDHAIRTLQYASDFVYEKDEENRLVIIK